MAAPAYAWKFKFDLWGNRVPIVVTLEATTSLETLEGTLLFMSSGRVDNAGASSTSLIGLAAEATSSALNAGDPIKVELIAPGMVIEGTATADASTLSGFNGKLSDTQADGRLDQGDASGGCLSVYKTSNSGLTVQCVITEFDMGTVN